MDLELISFKICPFVQRAVITLHHKNIPFRIKHIDLAAPPDWFQKLSPFGKTPLLRVDDTHSIFESAVIDEFLDDITPGRLLPEDPLRRALDRSWIEFGSAMILHLSGLIHGKTREGYEKNLQELQRELLWLEGILGAGPWFNGQSISLVDFAYAPLFMRMAIMGLDARLLHNDNLARTRVWAERLNALPVVQNSVVPEFRELLLQTIRQKGAYAAQILEL